MVLSWVTSLLGHNNDDSERDNKRPKFNDTEKSSMPIPPPATAFDQSFIHRPLLKLPTAKESEMHVENNVRIMTYNVLAQALVNRDIFPDSGSILKWKNRSKVFPKELITYSPDILCLQEVDTHTAERFWRYELKQMGLQSRFTTSKGKTHGQIIGYKESRFEQCGEVKMIEFDQLKNDVLPSQFYGGNTAMLLRLKDNLTGKTLVVGNTHLFWHPSGTYERARQMLILLEETISFSNEGELVFLCGDFNSRTFDTSYLRGSNKPLDAYALKMLKQSVATKNFTSILDLKGPSDEEVTLDEEQTKRMNVLLQEYDKLKYRCKSLYSVYNQVHPNNADQYGEPFYSNWAHNWRGLLDYIFVIVPKSLPDTYEQNGRIQYNKESDVKVTKLLRVPEDSDMGEDLDMGLPRAGEYPSDHFAMMAVVNI